MFFIKICRKCNKHIIIKADKFKDKKRAEVYKKNNAICKC